MSQCHCRQCISDLILLHLSCINFLMWLQCFNGWCTTLRRGLLRIMLGRCLRLWGRGLDRLSRHLCCCWGWCCGSAGPMHCSMDAHSAIAAHLFKALFSSSPAAASNIHPLLLGLLALLRMRC